MSLTTIISVAQSRSKDSYASSPTTGLALRTNGEEIPKVIDYRGNVYPAGFIAPTVAPTVTTIAGGGSIAGWRGYIYIYASSRFPFVNADTAIDGKLWPRSNFGPSTTADMLAGSKQITAATVTGTTQAGIDYIWIFRTLEYSSSVEAQTAADAGQAYFLKQVANDITGGTVAWTDNISSDSVDQAQADNFVAPQMQFAVFNDPYWWGFGNMPFQAPCSFNNSNSGATGKITLTGADTWFTGRDGQNVTLDGVTTGGIDGVGTFLFKWLTSTTATVTIDGTTPIALPTTGVGNVTIQGPSTTLFRSKSRNPFAWGFTETIGEVNVPQQYAFKVGGGLGSAIGIIPNSPTLKLDTEYPTACYTLNLRSAGTNSFENTLRIISTTYSVTAHFSQFAAITQQGQSVLWGMDFKNFAVVQSDGITQQPVSGPIPQALRALTTDRTKQLLTHGLYDPKTELNCIWIATLQSLSLVNYLIYMHVPTGFWGFADEQDILSSASIEDTSTGNRKTYVGTQTGLLGQALVSGMYGNWLPETGTITGLVASATSTSITISVSGFNTTDNGIIGNWCLITDSLGQQEQWARISARSGTTLTFDWVRSFVGGGTAAFNPVPVTGWKFFIGIIECSLLKYFDFNQPQTSKRLMELWLTQQNVDSPTQGTTIRMFKERQNTFQQFAPLQMNYDDATLSDAWFCDTQIPSEMVKMFGLQFINRGYKQWRFINLTLKPNLVQ